MSDIIVASPPMRPAGRPFTPAGWAGLAAILAIGLGLRLGLALVFPNLDYPDEIYQTLEPAHRLLTGWGVVPWEWREGIRSWLFPGFLAAVMAVARAIGLHNGLGAVALVLALLSLVVPAAGYGLGWRRHGLAGALIGGGLGAVWIDLVYFGPKTLTEVVGGHLLVVACWLSQHRSGVNRGRVLALGLILGLAFCLRFHLAPALGIVALWACRAEIRRSWLPLLLGAAVPVLASGMLDLASWGSPFQSIWKNIAVNVIDHRADRYGTFGPWEYGWMALDKWGAAVVPLTVAALLGAGRAPVFALAALAVVISHSLIGHKEYRFLYPAIALTIVLAGVGTAEILDRFPGRSRVRSAGAALALWSATALAVGASPAWSALWRQSGDPLKVMAAASRRPDLCGFDIHGLPWGWSGGYTWLNRPVPLFQTLNAEEIAATTPAANYVLAPIEADLRDGRYRRDMCSRGFCLMRRDGGCDGHPATEINARLVRDGE